MLKPRKIEFIMQDERKKAIKDIEDIDHVLREMEMKTRSFTKKIIGLGLDYQNKISGKPSNEYFFEIRDSISYRLQSCAFLFKLLTKNHNFDRTHLSQVLPDQLKSGITEIFAPGLKTIYTNATIESRCLFDSSIYHLVSTFDYISGLTELICGGTGRNRLKWNSLVNKIQDKSTKHSQSKACHVILKGHNDFVNSLYRHRSTIIHDSADIGGFEYSVNIKSGISTLYLFVTKRFINEFTELKKIAKENRITLRYATSYLINKAIDLLIDILINLREDIDANKKFDLSQAITFIKNKKGEMLDASTPYWN